MSHNNLIVIISANAEWRGVRRHFSDIRVEPTPYGESFVAELGGRQFRFLNGGWGKIAAAGSAQYAIDHWQPHALINLGTCGGFAGRIERGEIVLVEKTVVYDIIEQMGDFESHIRHYSTDIDTSWLPQPYPIPVRPSLLVSADRDLVPGEIEGLAQTYGAVAGDWESGAIAWIARRSGVRTLILRGVTDLVDTQAGEAYGNLTIFEKAAEEILYRLVASLPAWVKDIS